MPDVPSAGDAAVLLLSQLWHQLAALATVNLYRDTDLDVCVQHHPAQYTFYHGHSLAGYEVLSVNGSQGKDDRASSMDTYCALNTRIALVCIHIYPASNPIDECEHQCRPRVILTTYIEIISIAVIY